MLTLFPSLLFLGPFSAFLIRLAVAGTFGYLAFRHVISPGFALKVLSIVEGVAAVLLFTGGYTQAAALLCIALVILHLFSGTIRRLPRSTLILIGIMSLSLLLTGPGPFAFDLPL